MHPAAGTLGALCLADTNGETGVVHTLCYLSALFGGAGFRVTALESLNVLGIPGWFLNGRVLKRRGVPPLQLRLYDLVSPLVARAESRLKPEIGMSLLAVGEAI